MPSIAKYTPEKSRFGFSHNITPEVVSEQSCPTERGDTTMQQFTIDI